MAMRAFRLVRTPPKDHVVLLIY